MSKKTVKYVLKTDKNVRCYIEAPTAEEAEAIFAKLVKSREAWAIAETKDTSSVMERFSESMGKQ